ncbi:alpha-N-arabinofuranosidase [Arthrobacter sp. DNA4]|uniref:arabinosylfuranosidase ArfA n=1 Tax=Micrococcaceae TaxID=1268 RepID=UPI0020CD6E91|nr:MULTISPECIES: alpha-N-arabinofuranosidase [Micrococcaceae]UTT69895.1 alpha-N-arabinofuranosidase [Arthrobacter sp. DNA4]WRT14217.1 alpha-N-arabinofuranosidase [Pseudarthrobacter sp. LT1]
MTQPQPPAAKITVDPSFTVGPVRRRTFGAFVEHLGRCVYTGIFEPEHPEADEDGFRKDVLELTRELGVSTVRYPGGNFVSGYRWEDGVGPVDQRPARLDLAWHSTDPNTVGVDEFAKWSAKAGVEPMMAVNLGTRGVQEALDLVEYCNIDGGTALSEQRRTNGAGNGYGIKMWCLGNEMDGPWQIGHKNALEYGRLAADTARGMRMIDPDLELVACGSSGPSMPTFGEWERVVLTETYDLVDLISAHQYFEDFGDLQEHLAAGHKMEAFIRDIVSHIDHVKSVKKSSRQVNISFDEWNVWHMSRDESKVPTGKDWPVAPVLLEDTYTVADAVVVGDLLVTLLRNTDRVHSASLAQLVNVIAPIMTEPGGRSWKQTTFHPFALTSRHASGTVLQLAVESPLVSGGTTTGFAALSAVATYDPDKGEAVVFAVNRSAADALALDAAVAGLGHVHVVEAVTYANKDPYWQASADDSTSVLPSENGTVKVEGGRLTAELPAVSWSMIRLAVES